MASDQLPEDDENDGVDYKADDPYPQGGGLQRHLWHDEEIKCLRLRSRYVRMRS